MPSCQSLRLHIKTEFSKMTLQLTLRESTGTMTPRRSILKKARYSGWRRLTIQQIALLSVYTGLRRADIINLEWKDINLRYKNKSNICLTIRKTKTVVSLPLSASATRLLRSISRDGPRVFPGLTEFMLNKEVPLLVEKAKIDKHITFHCFRHSFAMALLNKGTDIYTIGTDIYTIAKLMGHRSVTSTQVYAKLSDEQLRKAILKL